MLKMKTAQANPLQKNIFEVTSQNWRRWKEKARKKKKRDNHECIKRTSRFHANSKFCDERHRVLVTVCSEIEVVVGNAFTNVQYLHFLSSHSQGFCANNSICFHCPLKLSSSFWMCNPIFSGFLTIYQKGKKRNQVDPHSNPTLSTDKDMNNCLLFPWMEESFHF